MLFYPRAEVVLGFVLDYPFEARSANFTLQNFAGFGAAALDALDALRRRFPEIAERFDANIAHLVRVAPQELHITRNPYTAADECKIKIDYRHFPFDPRIARAVAVECHLGTAPSIDAPFIANSRTRRFIGYADTGDWSWDDDDTITFVCRDHTALLIDTPWLDRGQLDLKNDLQTIIRAILDQDDATRPIALDFRALPPPILAQSRSDVAGDKQTASTRQSVWDTIVELVSEAGLIAWIEQRTLIVDGGQTLRGLPSTPFVAGRNLKSLRVRRHIGRKRTPPVTVEAWNVEKKEVLSATWPALPDDAPTGEGATQKPIRKLRFTLSNIIDQAVLIKAARNIWLRFALLDLAVEFETNDVRGPNDEFLLDLKPGSPVAIHFSEDERIHLNGRPFEQRRAWLAGRGYSGQVATAIAYAYEQLTPAYQVVEIGQHFRASQGITLSFRCASYITAD